jgi:tRNA(Ile)-lysidine synthase
MASSRKSKPSNSVSNNLTARIAARLKTVVKPGARLLLGLSGGIDSMVLLDVLARLAKRGRFELQALHVNHQLSPNAGRWARFCRAACAERALACRIVKVRVGRGNSIEGAARDVRYAALNAAAADYIVLAHNADDQAETVLLQLLRGAGVKGLAAMPFLRAGARGKARAQESVRGLHPSSLIPHPPILRPLLDTPRAEIERYARRRKLMWIEDESNTDTGYQRNWLRHELLPLIAARVPGYRATLTRAAHHFGEAAVLLDDLARHDAGTALASGTISVAHLQSLSAARAKNVLRLMIASRGWRMPDAERLQEALRQVRMARADAKLRVELGGYELRRHRDMLYLLATDAQAAVCRVITWHGERELLLPEFGGLLTMAPRMGRGMRARQLRTAPVTIRPREGGERLQCHANRPRRTLKNLLQEARIPPWERERIPFIYCGDLLVCVPGVGVDHRFQAGAGEAAIAPMWRVL